MFTQLVSDKLECSNSVAFLVCVYKNDDLDCFKEMLVSLNEIEAPKGFEIRVYLHIDGVLPSAFNPIIDDFHPYKVLQSEQPVGLANGLNKLIEVLADESYYFRMDSDDICHPQRVINQFEFMEKNPNIDFCGSSISEFIGVKENQVNIRTYPSDLGAIKKQMIKGSPFAHVTVCFRAGFFKKFGPYPTEYTLNEDIALWYLALKNGAVASNLGDVLVYVRMDSAYSRRTYHKAVAEFKVYRAIARWSGRSAFYPTLRFIFRLLPVSFVKSIYNSRVRNLLLNK
jgi:hypothetical protein